MLTDMLPVMDKTSHRQAGMEALKELKAHDLRAFHERVDAVEARIGQFEVTRQAIVKPSFLTAITLSN